MICVFASFSDMGFHLIIHNFFKIQISILFASILSFFTFDFWFHFPASIRIFIPDFNIVFCSRRIFEN